ncbi:PREDICTED: translin [Tinamus guttatus]|nr:PREDICTED: translin [Tinamus guttatus]
MVGCCSVARLPSWVVSEQAPVKRCRCAWWWQLPRAVVLTSGRELEVSRSVLDQRELGVQRSTHSAICIRKLLAFFTKSCCLSNAECCPASFSVPKKCQKAREHFGTVRTQLASLKTKFPADQYYRFHEHWRFVLQRLVFLAAFVVYLEAETLVTREAVAEILGIEADRERGFHLDIEDYLSGVLTLASELARLAVNSVTAGDYSRPLRISTFINELDSGFRLLNLKNDSLRKRYDGLKYDVKKIEEVVYDLSIRGLNKEATGGVGGEK